MSKTLVCSLIRSILRRLRKQNPTYQVPLHVTLNNLMSVDKRSHVKGTISLCHCRGHDCIMLVLSFDGFYDMHVRLFPENYYFR